MTEQLQHALDVIEHYHEHHTNDKVTRFHSEGAADIYVVSDPEWKAILLKATDPAFPARRPKRAH